MRGYPIEDTVFVERVSKISYTWGKDGPKGWELEMLMALRKSNDGRHNRNDDDD